MEKAVEFQRDERDAGRSGRWAKTIGYFGAFVSFGLAASVFGPTLPGLAEQVGAATGAISLLFSARSLGYLVGCLQAGGIYDRVAGHSVLGIALLGVAGMLAVVPIAPVLWLLLLAMLFLGLAEGMVEVGTNALLLWVHRERAGPVINGLHFSFGFGALLSPVFVGWAIGLTGDGRPAYWLLALLIVPVAVWVLRQPSPERNPVRAGDSARSERPGLVVLTALFFLVYAGLEISTGAWLPTYVQRMGLAGAATASYLASAFWAAFTAGRLLSIGIAVKIRPAPVIVAGAAGALAALLVLLLWPRSEASLWGGTILLGFSLAPVVPMTLALVERCMAVTGRATSWFFGGLAVGAMFFPWLIGQLMDGVGPRSLLVVMLADLALGWVLLALLLADTRRKPCEAA